MGPPARGEPWSGDRDKRLRGAGDGDAAPREDNHLLDLAPGATSFAIPTPFPCDHRETPWIGGEEADLADQVEVARRMLEALHPRLEPLSPVGGPSGGGRPSPAAR